MLIAQLTDLHALPETEKLDGILDTNELIEAAVRHLRLLDLTPDVVLLTGDLTENGEPASYAALTKRLDPVGLPVLAIPGNHDRRRAFRAAFRNAAYMPRTGFVQYVVERFPLRLVALDILDEGKGGGKLCPERLGWLERTLTEAPERDTVIFMHHPPFATGIQWMDAGGFEGLQAFQAIVSANPQVQAVLCGHLHRPISARIGTTPVFVAPSTCYQVHLDLTAHSKPQIIFEPPACHLHQWGESGLVTHTSLIQAPENPIDLTAPSWREKVHYARGHQGQRES